MRLSTHPRPGLQPGLGWVDNLTLEFSLTNQISNCLLLFYHIPLIKRIKWLISIKNNWISCWWRPYCLLSLVRVKCIKRVKNAMDSAISRPFLGAFSGYFRLIRRSNYIKIIKNYKMHQFSWRKSYYFGWNWPKQCTFIVHVKRTKCAKRIVTNHAWWVGQLTMANTWYWTPIGHWKVGSDLQLWSARQSVVASGRIVVNLLTNNCINGQLGNLPNLAGNHEKKKLNYLTDAVFSNCWDQED